MTRCARLCVAASLLAAGALACQTPAALPLGDPIGHERRFAPIVPDALDHAAADLAVAALSGEPAQVTGALGALESAERDHQRLGDPTGLVPAGIEAADAVRFPGRAGRAAAERLLERDDLDAASRERLERWLADDPLALAKERIGEARFIAVARLFNAVSEPVGRSIFSLTLLPFTLGRALAHYSIDFVREDALPLQRRQALAQWQRFRRQYPDAPEVAELAPEIEAYQADWRKTQYERARSLAEDAQGDGLPDAALFYARRARRHVDGEDARELAQQAERQIAARHRAFASAVRFEGAVGPLERGPVLAALGAGEIADVAAAAPAAPLADEQRFLHATALGRAGDDAAMWETLSGLADTRDSAMARHAAAELDDPVRHPYGAFVRARSAERRRTATWLLLGPLAARAERGVLGAVEYLLDLPWRVQGAALLPIRLLQLPWRGTTPGAAATAVHARRYLAASPRGAHAGEVRDWLEAFERERENWVGALRVAESRGDADDADLDALRERAAEQALRVASDEERSDLRAGLLANVARTFPETRAGGEAGREAREQVTEHTPHAIRLSRGFLLENPQVAGANGLDLAPELLDDEPRNGELHPDGVSLVGGRLLAISVLAESGDEDDPAVRLNARLSSEAMARLVAQLEETSFRNSLLDEDDALESDPQRDVLFERARLGLADDIDARPAAEARYAYRGIRERYGMVRSREALLPIELVLQGSLSDLTLGAFPRLRAPRATPDAVLYR